MSATQSTGLHTTRLDVGARRMCSFKPILSPGRITPCRSSSREADSQLLDRRSFLAASSAFAALLIPSRADAEVSTVTSGGSTQRYKDDRDNFSVSVPSDWKLSEEGKVEGTGPTARRRTLAWFEEGNPSSYVTVTVTNAGADYTKLGSFGTAEQFGSNLVASMDRSFLKRAPKWARNEDFPQEAKLVKTKENADTYFIEYTIQRQEGDLRHLLSSVALGYNGRYTRLYTLTAQCTEDRFEQEKKSLLAIIDSFEPPYARV